MAVEDVRAGIANATQQCQSGIAALQQAIQTFEEAGQLLRQVTAGSNQSEVDQANGQLASAIQTLGETQGVVHNAIDAAESYSNNRL